MRRKLKTVPQARNRAVVYSCALVAMGMYAIPKIPRLEHGLPGTFSMVWILFAVLALASNVYFLVGADKERSRMLETQELRPADNRVAPTRREGQRAVR